MTETLPCAWCDTEDAPATRCKDCGRPKCDLCARCEPCIDGPLAEPVLLLAATVIAGNKFAELTERIDNPDIRGTVAMILDPLFAVCEAAGPFTLAATWATLIQAALP